MLKPILISISPNTDQSDVIKAIKTIFKPHHWQKGNQISQLSTKLKNLLDRQNIWLFNAGRNALEIGLKSLNLKSTDEVLCQAFTCIAVPNAIKWAGAQPVFVDTVKNGFNISLKDIEKKLTKNSKALIVQHNFGLPDDLESIKKICQKHQLILIEDCAHTLGAKINQQPIGSFGDLTILSFGRDKAISSVFGGALLSNHKDLSKKIDLLFSKLNYPDKFWIFKQLLHPIFISLIKPTYFHFGKYLMFLYQKSGLLSWPVTKAEKSCLQSLPHNKLPNALATLALHQLNKLESINQTRFNASSIYAKSLKTQGFKNFPLLRFPILVKNPRKLIKQAKKHQILLGDWYRPVIAPKGVNLTSIGYQKSSCPNAEAVSQKVINLPTNVTQVEASRIVNFIKTYA